MLDARVAYDAALGAVVEFGGKAPTSPSTKVTRRWTGASWEAVVTPVMPPARSNVVMAADPATGGVLVIGGGDVPAPPTESCAPSTPTNAFTRCTFSMPAAPPRVAWSDPWSWSLMDNWRALPSAGAPQLPLASAVNPRSGAVIVVGMSEFGQAGRGSFDGTWEYTSGGWSLLSRTAPSTWIGGLDVAYDPISDRMIAYDSQAADPAPPGYGRADVLAYTHTWILEPGGWKLAHPTNSPTPARGVLTSNGAGDGLLLVTALGDTWAWTGDAWKPVATTNRPAFHDASPGGVHLVAAADVATKTVVVVVTGYHDSDSTWTLRDATWTEGATTP